MNQTWKVTGSAAAIALAAAACSSGSDQASSGAKDVKLVQAAYTTTAKARTAKAHMRVRLGGSGEQLDISADGGVNLASQQAEFTISLPQGIEEQVVYVDKKVYEKLPRQLLSRLHVNTQWITIDLDKVVREKTGSSLTQLQQQQPDNPLDQLSYLRSVSSTVTKEGTATIDGTKTTHYRARIDLDQQKSEAVRRLEQASGSHSLPVQVWIDGQGRLRKMQLQEKVQQPSGSAMTITAELTLSDFGSPVAVQAPPKGTTTDVTRKLTGGR